jgi:lysyl-tRNA synthetase class 2
MKRLLGAGSGNIFQISRCFRNGDFANPVHNPEFRLLEWYTVESGYLESVAVVEDLFAHLLEATAGAPPRGALQPPFLRLTMAEAFQMHAGIDLASCSETEKLASEGRRQGLTLPSDLTWEVAFHMIFLTLVEPNLPREKPLALLDYPALIPTTARRKPGTPWAERWELYVDGVEIANCYTEETDHGVLERLFEAEAKRKEGCRVRHRVDVGLTGAFPAGFPRCSGGAMGVDRLEMIFFNEKTLEGVIPFPFSAIVKGNT